MKVCVVGLWHLGTVTAACLASGGHDVRGFDDDLDVVERLQAGEPPIFEPGLPELVATGLASERLTFTGDASAALSNAEVVWITYDTPVNEDDEADVELVFSAVTRLFPHFQDNALVLISSQLPIGTTSRLEHAYAVSQPHRKVSFACSPENLRLGKAIQVFTNPDRVVVGLRQGGSSAADKQRVSTLLSPFTSQIEWMSVESAEMTKHALNAFLATSVAYINEVAALCEKSGADAKDVQRGLKSDVRIGPGAYLNPGAAFAGGTLARDLSYLERMGAEVNERTELLSAVLTSNTNHKTWVRRKLELLVGDLRDRTIAVWGLTYKPHTNTLRRSDSVALCKWLISQGAKVNAHDPSLDAHPRELPEQIKLCPSPLGALEGAEALVLSTAWPVYAELNAEAVVSNMRIANVIDPNRFLENCLGKDLRIRYASVGMPDISSASGKQ